MNIKEYLRINEDSFTLEFRDLYIYFNNGQSIILNTKTKEKYFNISNLTYNTALSEFFNLDIIFPKHPGMEGNKKYLINKNRRIYAETAILMNLLDTTQHKLKWSLNESNNGILYTILNNRMYVRKQLTNGEIILIPEKLPLRLYGY